MKDSLRKMFRVIFVGALLLLLALLVLCVVLIMKWPLRVGLFLTLLIAGGVCAGFFLRRLWLRNSKQSFTDALLKHEMSGDKSSDEQGRVELKELHTKWKHAVEILRHSHLRKQGDPLYALPWYLVIGESGTGKTTSLSSAMLSSPLMEKNTSAGAVSTKNCDWWFFNEAIAIDTAGRYCVPIDEDRDKEEWRDFLRLLAKYRKREPLNGVIVTIPVDRLQSSESDTLAADGKTIRHRIDELMSVLGVRLPIYLLVTKCDRIHGMKQFTDLLPEKCLTEAMGFTNQELSTDVAAFIDEGLTTIGNRLRNLQLRLLLEPQAAASRPGLLLFPEELANLKTPIAAFVETAFGSNQYQETPILRAIFFSSGRQQGVPYSTLATSLGIASEQEPMADLDKGLFLHDLFTKILPQDRWMFAPTRQAIQWQRITGNLGLVAWIIVNIAICGLLSFSFVKNLATIRQLSQDVSRPPEIRGELVKDFLAMERYRQQIAVVEERNRHWWIPRFGLNASVKLEEELKTRFCRKFRDGFLASFDKTMAETMATFTPAVSDQLYGQYVVHLTRRINLLKARQDGKGFEALKGTPQPDYVPLLAASGTAPDLSGKANSSYLCYLMWRTDPAEITKETSTLQTDLKGLLAIKGDQSQWLSAWVNSQSGIHAVTLAQFWGGSVQTAQEINVAPVFTRKGKEEFQSVVGEIKTALADRNVADKQVAEFEKWYRGAHLAAWQAFAAAFPRGVERLRGEREWQEVAAKMSTDQSPFFKLLNQLATEFEVETTQGTLPDWLRQLYLLQVMKGASVPGGSGAVDKATDNGKRLLATLKNRLGDQAGAQMLEATVAGSQAYREYRQVLTAIAPATVSKTQAYQAAAQLFAEDPAVSKSPFVLASASSRKLEAALSAGTAHNPMLVRLINGPLDFLWTFVRKEASAHLQSQWEEQVLAGTMGMTGQQTAPVLLGQDGLVWKFVKGPAAPFLTRSLRGYRPKEVLGGTVPFESAFLSFLDHGSTIQAASLSKQNNYSVGIQALPTDTNDSAQIKPQATRLELQCGALSQTLVNLNYPTGKTFNWSPDSCGDVVFQIELGDLVLTKRYAGPQGFPEFLQSFPGGRHTFHPQDFPGESKALQKMGVKYIKANYQFIGSGPVVRQTGSTCGQVPRSIAKCWTF